jgi:hypothetical protein
MLKIKFKINIIWIKLIILKFLYFIENLLVSSSYIVIDDMLSFMEEWRCVWSKTKSTQLPTCWQHSSLVRDGLQDNAMILLTVASVCRAVKLTLICRIISIKKNRQPVCYQIFIKSYICIRDVNRRYNQLCFIGVRFSYTDCYFSAAKTEVWT